MTSASPYPRAGAKILLERREVSHDGDRAEYQAYIYTPSRRYELCADLSSDGSASLTPRGEQADPAAYKALENVAKSIARAAPRKREAGLPPWPQRIHRWRAAPGRS